MIAAAVERQPRRGSTLADAIALAPQPKAYHDVWLSSEQMSPDAEQADGVGICSKVICHASSKPRSACRTTATSSRERSWFSGRDREWPHGGYNVTVGGGFGRTSGNKNTFPFLGHSLCFVEPDEVVATAEAVVKFFRDHGNRADRKIARLKYVIHNWGMDRVREVFARDYWQKPLRSPLDLPITSVDLHHGWQDQGDGKLFLGLSVESGRIKDEGSLRLRSGLRAIVEKFKPIVRITTQQDILLGDIDPANRPGIDALLTEYGIPRPESLSLVRKWSMACPAIPTCGLALTESERTLPGVIDELERTMIELGLSDEPLSVRMTGCPNGCARPYNPDVSRRPQRRQVHALRRRQHAATD